MNLHYSQTLMYMVLFFLLFVYHMNLHYSQTASVKTHSANRFVYHMNLHYSQTWNWGMDRCFWFVYHMNLHYSQTDCDGADDFCSLSTIWIYTTLKRCIAILWQGGVCLPYEFTLLSNTEILVPNIAFVCLPYEFTLLSNKAWCYESC